MARGSTTVVYKGYEEETGQVVLLKVLTREAAQDPLLVNWFENEAEHVASIEHPNVVSLFRAGRDEDGRPFLVAEYIEGASLSDVLAQHGPLPPELAAFVGAQIASGLAAAHKAGILHRDLNPSNVLIGSDGSVKLTDFGLATQLEAQPNDVNIDVRGTPGYLAPEVVLGKEAGEPADLFALGATVIEAIAGHKAFPARTVQEALDAAIHHDPVSGLLRDPRVPPSLANAVGALMDRDPEGRASAADSVTKLTECAFLPATENEPVRPETLAAFLENPAEYESLRPVVDYRLTEGPRVTNASISIPAEQYGFWRRRGIRVASMSASLVLVVVVAAFALMSSQQSESNPDAVAVGTDRADSLGVVFPNEPQDASSEESTQNTVTIESERPDDVTTPELERQPVDEQSTGDVNRDLANPTGQVPAVEPEARAEIAKGRLSISVQPWAEVFMDGRKVGEGARVDISDLAVGTHQVSLRNPEFPNVSRSVEIQSGEQTLAVSLWQHVARITLQVNPWASVKVDGRSIGDVPPERTVILRPGPHTVELTHPQLGTWSGTIRAVAGERRSLPYNLTQLLRQSGN